MTSVHWDVVTVLLDTGVVPGLHEMSHLFYFRWSFDSVNEIFIFLINISRLSKAIVEFQALRFFVILLTYLHCTLQLHLSVIQNSWMFNVAEPPTSHHNAAKRCFYTLTLSVKPETLAPQCTAQPKSKKAAHCYLIGRTMMSAKNSKPRRSVV